MTEQDTRTAIIRSSIPHNRWPGVPPRQGLGVLAILFQLEHSQWWPAKVLQARQFLQLDSLLGFACKSVPYYRERFARLGWKAGEPLTSEIWSELPLLRRSDIEEHARDLLAGSMTAHGKTIVKHTSGSSGRPIAVTRTELAGLFWNALTLRDHLWHRRDFSAGLVTIRSGREATDPLAVQNQASWGTPAGLIYDTGPMTLFYHRMPLARQAEILCARNPRYLLAYPSNLLELSDYFRTKGLILLALTAVRTYGEPVDEDVRGECRTVWGVPVTDMYSCEEVGISRDAVSRASTLSRAVRGRAGREPGRIQPSVRAGADRPGGDHFATRFRDAAHPLRDSDYAEAAYPCDCGRGLPVVALVSGRRRHLAALPDGRCFVPEVRKASWTSIGRIERLQLVQKLIGQIEINVAAASPLTEVERRALIAAIGEDLRHPFELSITELDEIPRHDNGKLESFVSEISWPDDAPPRIVA